MAQEAVPLFYLQKAAAGREEYGNLRKGQRKAIVCCGQIKKNAEFLRHFFFGLTERLVLLCFVLVILVALFCFFFCPSEQNFSILREHLLERAVARLSR